MNSPVVRWKLTLVCAVLLGTAAGAPSKLTCNVTRQPDLSFMYKLSRPPDYPSCQTQWEDKNKISIVSNSSYDEHIVQSLTDRFVVLKYCEEYLHHSRDCLEGFQEAHCTANCSLLLNEEPGPVTVNSTLTCVLKTWCPDLQTIRIICIVIAAAIVIIAFGVTLFIKYRRGRSVRETTTYSPAAEEIKMML